jgi:hypothetical protein
MLKFTKLNNIILLLSLLSINGLVVSEKNTTTTATTIKPEEDIDYKKDIEYDPDDGLGLVKNNVYKEKKEDIAKEVDDTKDHVLLTKDTGNYTHTPFALTEFTEQNAHVKLVENTHTFMFVYNSSDTGSTRTALFNKTLSVWLESSEHLHGQQFRDDHSLAFVKLDCHKVPTFCKNFQVNSEIQAEEVKPKKKPKVDTGVAIEKNERLVVRQSQLPIIYLFKMLGIELKYDGPLDVDSITSFIQNKIAHADVKRGTDHEEL